MASNVVDLSEKIRTIELTVPDDTDPHLKHLLKRMLDKDYHSRILLEDVVIDDWVTLEGSDPLFVEDDTDDVDSSTALPSLSEKLTSLKPLVDIVEVLSPSKARVLLVSSHAVLRKSAADLVKRLGREPSSLTKINGIVAEIFAPEKTGKKSFDFIVCECDVSKESDMKSLQQVRSSGYAGCIVVLVEYQPDMSLRDDIFEGLSLVTILTFIEVSCSRGLHSVQALATCST